MQLPAQVLVRLPAPVLVLLVSLFAMTVATAMSTASTSTSTSANTCTSSKSSMTEQFHACAAAAVELSNAQVVNKNVLLVERSVRDWDLERRQTFVYSIPLTSTEPSEQTEHPGDHNDFIPLPTPLDPSIVARLGSPSRNYTLVIKSNSNIINAKNNIVEIWQGASRIRRLSLEKLHGSIITKDVTFGSPSWSSDESFCVYAAERLPVPTMSYWDADTTPGTSKQKGTRHVLGQGVAEDWGEKYSTQEPLLDLYVLHIATGRVERIPFQQDQFYTRETTLGSVSLGQPVIHPEDPIVAFTCFDAGGMGSMKRRLGMIFCRNRPSQIFTADIGSIITRLSVETETRTRPDDLEKDAPVVPCICASPDFALARSPRYVSLTNGNVQLLFLGNKQGFLSHDGVVGLYYTNNGGQELLPPVENPLSDGPQVGNLGFPGLFTSELPTEANLKGSNLIVIGTMWGSISRLLLVDVISGKWNLLDIPTISTLSSHGFLCQVPNSHDTGTTITVIISETAPNLPCRLWKVSFPKTLEKSMSVMTGQAMPLGDLGSIACSAFSSVKTRWEPPFDVHLLNVATDTNPIQAVLLLPRRQDDANTKVPLVVVPHGGPHSVSTMAYVPGFALLATQYAVVLPNYRGSIGFGQTALTSLLTRIGRMDVEDVMACTKHVLESYESVIDPARVAICGGSHGGFLAAHCTSQYPEFFQAAVMRNPVTNIASMVTSTDIPDWCFAECLGEEYPFRGPTKDEMNTMYEKSPISKVSDVQTPTLIALGMQDLRVPPSQGKEWYYTLRANGVPTELLIYPKDDHSLAMVATEADHWIRIMHWLDLYL